jgi:structure-specific recognition protein 1
VLQPPQKKVRKSPSEATAKKQSKEPNTKKKKKDPNLPKGSKNGYMFFSGFNRQGTPMECDVGPVWLIHICLFSELATDNPSMTIGEQGKELGRQWQAMSVSDKKMYLEMAEADKRRYMEEVTGNKCVYL